MPFDPQRDTDAFERFRERMQEDNDYDPCDFGCTFEETNTISGKRLFIWVPCNDCVETAMEDARIAYEEDKAEAMLEGFYNSF